MATTEINCACCSQIAKIDGRKVLQTRVLIIDDHGGTHKLCELLHTTRDYLGYLQPLQFIEQQLSRLGEDSNAGCAMAARRLLPAYTMTDKDMAMLNALSKLFNGVKWVP